MTERERLIELLNKAPKSLRYEDLPDYLLANGLIVPPCKVGDTVYKVIPKCTARMEDCPYMGGYGTPRCGKADEHCKAYIEEIAFVYALIDNIGVDVFVTKEEAEKAIRKINHNSL